MAQEDGKFASWRVGPIKLSYVNLVLDWEINKEKVAWSLKGSGPRDGMDGMDRGMGSWDETLEAPGGCIDGSASPLPLILDTARTPSTMGWDGGVP